MIIEIIKNLDTEKIKEKGKPLLIAAVCLVAVFSAGFGVGKSSVGGGSGNSAAEKRSLNYTTPAGDGQNDNSNQNKAQTNSKTNTKATSAAAIAAVDPNNCYIKGSKSKTYHMPGGAFYARTTPAACFGSEEEAVAAGYKKSSR
ncbi:MAG TPA: hypothetical protein VHQ20_00305 [Patescibacteria group bacterium]|jgi:hypothetical protein|nr:hypothetical protein [Patescibacteria group bacterium]